MKLKIYLEPAGCEYIAQGQVPWNWNFSVRKEGDAAPAGHFLVAECEAVLPERDVCVAKAVAHLEEEKRKAYVEAADKAKECDERIANLLAITWEAPQ